MFQFKKIVFTAVLSFVFFAGNAQSLKTQEHELFVLFEKLKFSNNDAVRDSVNALIVSGVRTFLETEDSYDFDFKELKMLGNIRSDDQKLRIYTWNTMDDDGDFHYFGFLQYYVRKLKKHVALELKDKSAEIQNPEFQEFGIQNWYGALYYKILERKTNYGKVYTLFGWDGNDNLSNKKLIETLTFDKAGTAKFGVPILEHEKKVIKNRIILEFGEQFRMLLHYDKNVKMIVFDHLAPPKPELEGQFQCYGPDSSFDGLFFESGLWKFYSNLNITNSDGENPTVTKPKSNTINPNKKTK